MYYINLPIGFMYDKVSDWDDLCSEIGLDPYCLNEGLASREDLHTISIKVAKKYNII